MLSRRHFLAAASAATLALARRAPAAAPPGDYVDMHTHIGQTWNTHRPAHGRGAAPLDGCPPHRPGGRPAADVARVVELFDHGRLGPRADAAVSRPPDSLLLASTPAPAIRGGLKGLVGHAQKVCRRGGQGLWRAQAGRRLRRPAEHAHLRRPAASSSSRSLFHIDNLRNLDKPGLPALENALRQNPNCNFVGHGPGWWAVDQRRHDPARLWRLSQRRKSPPAARSMP